MAAFFRAEAPRGALIIEGEAGVGKTTVWRAGLLEASRSGATVLSSSPSIAETQLSYTALADLFRDVFEDVASALPAAQRRALAVALMLSDSADAAAEQRTVLAATLSTLRVMAGQGPLVLAVDDIQWMDDASAEALAFALRRLQDEPVAVLCARRLDPGMQSDSVVEDALERRHGTEVRRIRLGPLPEAAIHSAIRDRFGVSFQHSLMQRIHHASGGNPLYAIELARALMDRPDPLAPGLAMPIPESLQALVRHRLEALPQETQELLDVVARLGDPTVALVEASGTAAGIDKAVAAGVLAFLDDERITFTHPLLAGAAAARLSPSASRALHRRLADLVEGEERARHLALSTIGAAGDVADELEAAANSAARRGALGSAAEFIEQSIRLTPADRQAELLARHLLASDYEVRHGDTERARAHLEPLRAQLDSGPARAEVLLKLARLDPNTSRSLDLSRQAIDEAGSAHVGAAAHQLAAEMSMLTGDVRAALEHARLACQIAERTGQTSILVESLGTLCHYQTYTGTIEPGLLERAVELEAQQPRPSNNYSPREIIGLRLMYSDRLDEARAVLEASLQTAEERGDELDRAALLTHLTQLECRAGRLGDAFRHARDSAVSREQTGWGISGARFATALADAHLGRVDEARTSATEGVALASAAGNEVFRVLNEWVLGFLDLSLGDVRAADEHLHGLPDAVERMGYWNPGVRPVVGDALEARIATGDLGVGPMIDELAERGIALDNPWARALAARCRGLLLAAGGEVEAAVPELESALELHQTSPQPLERGRTLLALGATQRRLKRRAAAREVLGQALDVFDTIGTPLWAEKAAAELARISGRTASPDALTVTERRVAELVADGQSNKEVAAALFITVRAVEANLSRVYAKLGLRSRTELATRLSRR
jgi:DNA-binding CsgD family transcriptional regulator